MQVHVIADLICGDGDLLIKLFSNPYPIEKSRSAIRVNGKDLWPIVPSDAAMKRIGRHG
jgi:hypothetical protein